MPHPLIDRWSWEAVDVRVANPDLNIARFAAELGATAAATRRFVKVRRILMNGRSTAHDIAIRKLLKSDVRGMDLIVYLRVAERICYDLALGRDVADLEVVNAKPDPPLEPAVREVCW